MFTTRMLLATDGSPESVRAARMAVGLSGKLGSELHVVHVGHIPGYYAVPETTMLDPNFQYAAQERVEEEAKAKLDEELERIKGMGGAVAEGRIRIGRPDAEIVHLAEDLGVGLVVLGSRGLGGLRRTLLGSVSDSVVRHAHTSVLVVRGHAVEDRDYLPGRILLAIDGSREAASATEAAVEITNATGSELHMLYVLQTDALVSHPHPLASERSRTIVDQAKHEARVFVDAQAERIESEGGKVKDAHLVFGKPAREIVKLSEELEAGLIVTGSRGLGGIRRALMGSVSSSVVRHAHCPVLVVRAEERQVL